jgi:hypothetical protein
MDGDQVLLTEPANSPLYGVQVIRNARLVSDTLKIKCGAIFSLFFSFEIIFDLLAHL